MVVIRARFDGEKVVLPEGLQELPPGEVLLIFDGASRRSEDAGGWMEAQEAAFQKVWDNDEDAVYDSL